MRVAFGPEMAGWGSWEWVGEDIARELGRYFRTCTFPPWELPDADVVVVVKHAPPREWLEAAARRGRVVYAPVDFYGSAGEIDSDGAMLRKCARVVVHCERLRRYFEPYARVRYVDHHLKFTAEVPPGYRDEGFILWVGVRTNLPALVAWVNRHSLPGKLVVLTNLEDPSTLPRPRDIGFREQERIRIENWTAERQRALTGLARAALDVKGQDFRSRHKPPAKALDFIASGLPLAMNEDSCVVEHLAGMGFDVASPLEPERWLSPGYWEETRRFGLTIRQKLTLEEVGRRWRSLIENVVSC